MRFRPFLFFSGNGVTADRRVIVVTGGIQWILQVQRSDGSWSNRSYGRTRQALINCCGGSTLELDALPERIGDRVAPTTDRQEAAERPGAGEHPCSPLGWRSNLAMGETT